MAHPIRLAVVPPSMVNAAPVNEKSVVGLTRWLTRSVRSFLEILFHRIPVEQIPVSIDDRAQRTDLACSRKFYFVVGNIDLDKLNLGTGSLLNVRTTVDSRSVTSLGSNAMFHPKVFQDRTITLAGTRFRT